MPVDGWAGRGLRCRDANEKDGMLSLNTDFELGSMIMPERGEAASQNPVIRQLRTDAFASVPLGKPAVIVSIEDTNSPRTVQVEVTATRLPVSI